MNHTTYSNLTDSEFLGRLEDVRGKSQIIDELVNRLEKLDVEKNSVDKYRNDVTCPVCEAGLKVDIDHGNFKFDLESD
jgi:hypothetical protein